MKRHLAALVLLLLAIPVAAQIPNPGFESWNADTTAVGWLTNTSPLFRTAVRTSPGHSGTYALQGIAAASSFVGIPPIIYAGAHGVIPFNQRPTALTGWYKWTPANPNDLMQVSVSTFQATTGTPVASGTAVFHTAVSSFVQFSVTLGYLSSATPDSAYVLFTIGHGVGSDFVTPGSNFVIDDIAFGTGTAVQEPVAAAPSAYALLQNFPNPFNPSTEIRYQVPAVSPVKLTVYNLLGMQMAVLVNETKAPGSYNVRFDASALPTGVYMYRLEAGSYTETRRMTLLK
jgi:hypothetical protein